MNQILFAGDLFLQIRKKLLKRKNIKIRVELN